MLINLFYCDFQGTKTSSLFCNITCNWNLESRPYFGDGSLCWNFALLIGNELKKKRKKKHKKQNTDSHLIVVSDVSEVKGFRN